VSGNGNLVLLYNNFNLCSSLNTSGGGLYSVASGDVTITECVFSCNAQGERGFGGGLYLSGFRILTIDGISMQMCNQVIVIFMIIIIEF
jgi:hypothetical protein